MPGKKCVLTIADKSWELEPFAGLKAIKLMPKVISIGAELLWNANDGGLPITDIFLSGTEDLKVDLTAALRSMKFVADTLGERYDELALEIIPFLLQVKDKDWLWNNGSLEEIIKAIYEAIKFHITTTFGDEVLDALKKSVAVEEAEPEKEATD